MSQTTPLRESTSLSLTLRVADLPNRDGLTFKLAPDATHRQALARQLDIPRIRKLTFTGKLSPDGRHDWRLEGILGATVVQECVITTDPVTTRIDVPVARHYLRQMPEPEGVEAEIPEDDTLEPLGPQIDLGDVMAEALALALPDYPRTPGAELESLPEETAPIRRNPFAALAALKRDDT